MSDQREASVLPVLHFLGILVIIEHDSQVSIRLELRNKLCQNWHHSILSLIQELCSAVVVHTYTEIHSSHEGRCGYFVSHPWSKVTHFLRSEIERSLP